MLEPANFRVEALAHAQRQSRKYPFVGPASDDLVQGQIVSVAAAHVPGIFENSELSLRSASAAVATNCRRAATMARKSIRGAQLGQSLLICAFD